MSHYLLPIYTVTDGLDFDRLTVHAVDRSVGYIGVSNQVEGHGASIALAPSELRAVAAAINRQADAIDAWRSAHPNRIPTDPALLWATPKES